ncbi:gamma-glutamyltranspeptidase/glutathione hydrolase [Allocatelliglobosispora scoriae]|uniref:Gamma-glutamyltranspeptidase/glutathione hydrolase n=1 Tax=Allocatelliglobosispora scoriae TaxID=643052 RepID=A0A841BY66_9ACTN|nr:gamma-glutamyltransferase family protein [Allocatelliglobosispora scoriae]MBB5873104.1 gamma-glutamyltranspeptidase/glutathione hydrolase [Allocatelliglobosispora scoriae]
MRTPVYAPRGVVATSQPLAAQAGLAVLREGGSAVDAAVAAAITLTVVQPGSNDIGGDLFALVWDGAQLHGYNGSGRSPAALTLERMVAGGGTPTGALGGAQGAAESAPPPRGWLPVTVPGAPAGWRDLHARFGRVPFERLFADAIGYAEHGFTAAAGLSRSWARSVRAFAEIDDPACAGWAEVFGRAPRPGEIVRNSGAARTLRLLSGTRCAAFYTGEVADALDRFAAATGGLLTGDDLAAHEGDWVAPMSADYRGHTVHELPPNGQGVAALQAFALLDGFTGTDPHRQIEAMKLGFADAHAYVADPRTPTPDLLDPSYVAARRALITEVAGEPGPGDPMRGGTVYLAAADGDGMMVSLIQSTYLGFGSYVVLPGYGFGLQNRGAGFSLDPAHPNVAAGGKRPFHTIIPGFLSRDGEPVGPFGVMGGHMQPQGHVQLISATLDDGLDPQAALARPRWYWHAGRNVTVESDFPAAAVADLRRRGHAVTVTDDPSDFGMGQAIWRLPAGGYVAGSEPRADGLAAGY